MKFLILAAIIGLAAANPMNLDPIKVAMAMKVLNMDVSDMHGCSTNADCSAIADKPICCKQFKLCKAANIPPMQMAEGDCTSDSMCKPLRRCEEGKCHFSGPKACEASTDCLQGIQGITFRCQELARTAPGKRCYAKCAQDKDCHECEGDKCRIPQEFREKIGCCGGFCQKKSAC